jgi:hypothetical protein
MEEERARMNTEASQQSEQPTPGEDTVEGVVYRRITQAYLEKAAKELPQLFIEETEKKRSARKQATSDQKE